MTFVTSAAALLWLLGLRCGAAVEWQRLEAAVPTHDPVTSSWLRGGRPPAEERMSLTVALRVDAGRHHELERVLFEVSDPRHAKYGQHLSLDQVTGLLAVPEERVAATSAYFQAAGALSVEVTPNRDMLSVDAPVSAVEAALNTTIHSFSHASGRGRRILRASQPYGLPAAVAEHVVMIGELLQFPRLPRSFTVEAVAPGKWANDCDDPECKGRVTPGVLSKRYTVPASTATPSGNAMAVAEFQGQYFKKDDLLKFSSSCHVNATVDKVIGGNKPKSGKESELDIEYIRAVAPQVPLTVVYMAEYSLIKWVRLISSMSDAPQVHSVSYGNDEKQQSSKEYMEVCNTAFMKAGARGLSILFASGDGGVCGRKGCGHKSHLRFKPDFPAASPYITAVGGTDFLGEDIGDEQAWSGSGGGFSDEFPAPGYQKEAVAAYFAAPDADLPPDSMWNRGGRGYPDVAALGGLKNPYCVATGGHFQDIWGTSASCPVVAGIFARMNGLRLAAGKPALGFLNPLIYQNPDAFQDVEHGKNAPEGEKYGFKAVKGWDAATGLGTPDYEKLAAVVMPGEATEIVV